MEVGGEEDESLHRVTSLAWAGFQVLADRCVSWETQQSAVVSSGLAQQVKIIILTGVPPHTSQIIHLLLCPSLWLLVHGLSR